MTCAVATAAGDFNEPLTLPEIDRYTPVEPAETITCLGGPRHGKRVRDRGQPRQTFDGHLYCRDTLTLAGKVESVSRQMLFYMGEGESRYLEAE